LSSSHPPLSNIPPAPDPLLTVEQVAARLGASPDWVRDHSSRKHPLLPAIRIGGSTRAGLLRFRGSAIEQFVNEQERMSQLRRRVQ
jgi:hypothetical protein